VYNEHQRMSTDMTPTAAGAKALAGGFAPLGNVVMRPPPPPPAGPPQQQQHARAASLQRSDDNQRHAGYRDYSAPEQSPASDDAGHHDSRQADPRQGSSGQQYRSDLTRTFMEEMRAGRQRDVAYHMIGSTNVECFLTRDELLRKAALIQNHVFNDFPDLMDALEASSITFPNAARVKQYLKDYGTPYPGLVEPLRISVGRVSPMPQRGSRPSVGSRDHSQNRDDSSSGSRGGRGGRRGGGNNYNYRGGYSARGKPH